MATIPGFRLDITGASGSQGLLSPRDGWRAYVFPRGGNAAQDSTGTLITFDSATIASRFSVNNWVQVGTDTAKIVRVTAVGGNSMSVNSAVVVSENDRVFLIGNTQPSVSGGSATYITPNTLVRQRGDDSADLYSNSMITTNTNGLVQAYASPAVYDVMVQDGNGSNQGYVQDLMVGLVEGLSVTDAAFFGSSIYVTGWAFFGSTVTMHGALGVTGWATFGSTVTMHAALGVTGPVVLGATLTVSGGFSGTAIIPRLGQASTPTTGGAIRIVEGNVFPMTVAGVQAALNECKSLGGGLVLVPASAGIQMGSTSIKIPNKVALCGQGSIAGTSFTFVGVAGTSTQAFIENESQDGTQQAAAVENISIDGGKSTGAAVTAGLNFASLYSGTYVRSVRIINCSGYGARFIGDTTASGPYFIQDLTVAGSGNDNILVQHTFTGLRMADIDTESPGTGKACLRLQSDPTSVGRIILGALLENIYVENTSGDTTCYGVVLDGTQSCTIINYGSVTTASNNFASLLRIEKTGITPTYNNRVENLWTSGTQTNLIDDSNSGILITNSKAGRVAFYESPIIQGTDAPGYTFGVQAQVLGPVQSTATTITTTRAASMFHLSGVTTVDSVTGTTQDAGRRITFKLDNNPRIRHAGGGGNIRLNGSTDFVGTTNSSLSLIYDHTTTTWNEDGRMLL